MFLFECRSNLGEGVLEIGNDILRVLDSNGSTDEIVFDSEQLSVGSWH